MVSVDIRLTLQAISHSSPLFASRNGRFERWTNIDALRNKKQTKHPSRLCNITTSSGILFFHLIDTMKSPVRSHSVTNRGKQRSGSPKVHQWSLPRIAGEFLASLVLMAVCTTLLMHQQLHEFETRGLRATLLDSTSSSSSFATFYPEEDPIPNPVPADGNETFAACLLVMDDNHRLNEWIAYHYHVLPLRYMIIVNDPRSQSSPTFLLNEWRRQGMYIDEWTDADFWKKKGSPKNSTVPKLQDISEDADFQVKRDRHRGRQKYFYRACLKAMKEAQRTWVTLHDSDEFLVYNHKGGKEYAAWEKARQALHDESAHAKETRVKPNQVPPTTEEAGAMIRYIRHEQAAGLEYYQSPCIGVPRLQFGAAESPAKEIQNQVPSSIEADHLDTLKWRHHATRNDFIKNALGKVILDVSRIDIGKTPYFESLHRPIKKICKAPWHNDWSSGLRINHYLGSWESYSVRTQDARKGGERSREQWEFKAHQNEDATDDIIRPWVNGFVNEVGAQQANVLLKGNGIVPPHNDNQDHWQLLPDKLQKILATDKTVSHDKRVLKFDKYVRNKFAQKEAS